jgi:hypothetical protein
MVWVVAVLIPRRSPQAGAQVDGRRSIISSGGSQTLQREYAMRADSSRKHSSHGTLGNEHFRAGKFREAEELYSHAFVFTHADISRDGD